MKQHEAGLLPLCELVPGCLGRFIEVQLAEKPTPCPNLDKAECERGRRDDKRQKEEDREPDGMFGRVRSQIHPDNRPGPKAKIEKAIGNRIDQGISEAPFFGRVEKVIDLHGDEARKDDDEEDLQAFKRQLFQALSP